MAAGCRNLETLAQKRCGAERFCEECSAKIERRRVEEMAATYIAAVAQIERINQQRGCRAKVVQSSQRVEREARRVIGTDFGPLCVAALKCEYPQLGREVGGWIGNAACD